MRKNLVFFIAAGVCILLCSAFARAQCPEDSNDLGVCDTLTLETFCGDTALFSAVEQKMRVPIYVTHDDNLQPDGLPDSIAAFVIPLCYTSSNPAANAQIPDTSNRVYTFPIPTLWQSIFRHLECEGVTTTNWMMALSEEMLMKDWDTRILNLTGEGSVTDVFWLSLFPTGSEDQRFGAEDHVLLATITFHIQDSTTICLDSCFWPPNSRFSFTRSDATSYIPRTNMPWCHDYDFIMTVPPYFTWPENGVEDQSHNQNGHYSTDDFRVKDDDGTIASVTADVASLPGVANIAVVVVGFYEETATGHVEYDVTDHCQAGGTVTLTVTDNQGATNLHPEQFTITLTNDPPSIACPPNQSVSRGDLYTTTDYSGSDPEGGPLSFSVVSIVPAATNMPAFVGPELQWQTDNADALGDYVITLQVEDECGLTATCDFTLTLVFKQDYIEIGNYDCANPGQYVSLPVYLINNTVPFGGFELEFEFDYTALCFVDVDPGDCLDIEGWYDQDDNFHSWEYFTYRLLPCPIPPCQKYKVLVYGQAEIPNGHTNIGECIAAGSNCVLLYLNFVVSNNENLRGFKIPVCFEWEGTVENGVVVEDWECSENTFASCDGNTLYTSSLLCEYNPAVCDDPGGNIEGILTFQAPFCGVNCGGVDVCAAGPGACKRGDVNMNGQSYEVSDAVLFANYFVSGEGVFVHDLAYQICATDVNADGRPLTLSDLIYLIRVILHDAVAIPKLAPFSEVANVIVYNNTITVDCAASVAAMLFEFDGAVQPTLLANMEMVNSGSKVLVWSRDGYTFNTAEVLSFTGAQLVSVSAVDYNTRELKTTITAKAAPTAFALNPAYPNPFNPYVNLSFLLPEATNYSLKIYNVAGQLVRSYEGIGSTDLNVITWDGRDNAGTEVASGVYFYKLTAGGLSATEKMVMMK